MDSVQRLVDRCNNACDDMPLTVKRSLLFFSSGWAKSSCCHHRSVRQVRKHLRPQRVRPVVAAQVLLFAARRHAGTLSKAVSKPTSSYMTKCCRRLSSKADKSYLLTDTCSTLPACYPVRFASTVGRSSCMASSYTSFPISTRAAAAERLLKSIMPCCQFTLVRSCKCPRHADNAEQ